MLEGGRKRKLGEKLRKRSSRTAHTVHDRPGENFDRSGQSEFQKGRAQEVEKRGGGSKRRDRVAGKIEKHLYAGTNVTHPLGCSELRQ
ncbi:hypothetical protein ALC56_08955 [Trachymyrmex septentrionalis]|uniref:Uncharacterized protein n=1 Tax=Trachymyrmex septentrionalis TaxID=34720 RepID=A0A195FAU9_9HYME|nr:hypothetical protein ALC56_08955 [Trachymyrmex septentrionalis]